MAVIFDFPTDVSRFEKTLKKVIEEHYSNTDQERVAAEAAGREVVHILREIAKDKPLFNLTINFDSPEESEKAIKSSARDFSDKYANIISLLLVELFKAKVRRSLET